MIGWPRTNSQPIRSHSQDCCRTRTIPERLVWRQLEFHNVSCHTAQLLGESTIDSIICLQRDQNCNNPISCLVRYSDSILCITATIPVPVQHNPPFWGALPLPFACCGSLSGVCFVCRAERARSIVGQCTNSHRCDWRTKMTSRGKEKLPHDLMSQTGLSPIRSEIALNDKRK